MSQSERLLSHLDQHVIQSAIAAALGRESWNSFLNRLADRFGCRLAIIVLHDTTRGMNLVSETLGHSPEAAAQYRKPEMRDEWAVRAAKAGILGKRVARGSELISYNELKGTEFWEKVLEPDDIIDTLAIPVSGTQGLSGNISIHAHSARGFFTDEEVDLAASLRSHILDAAAVFESRVLQDTKLVALQAGLQSARTGVVLTDENRSILFACPTARQLLLDTDAVGAERGKLEFNTGDAKNLWERLANHSQPSSVEIALFGPDDTSCLALWAKPVLAPDSNTAVLMQAPKMYLFCLRRLDLDVDYDIRAAAVMWSLTETETRIAKGLMRGLTPTDIATTQNISANTVRWHIKNLLSKSNTNRHSELLMYLHKLDFITGTS